MSRLGVVSLGLELPGDYPASGITSLIEIVPHGVMQAAPEE